MPRAALLSLLLLPSLSFGAAQMRVDGMQIVVSGGSEGELRGAAVDGSELDLGELGTLRIERARTDPDARFPDDTWLLEASLRAPGATTFTNLCATDAKTDARMVIYSGYLDAQLKYVADATRFSLSCTSGVEAKCLRWGYQPWRRSPLGEVSLAPYFETCVRMARADYCGDDHATTRDGTSIDIYDQVGIQQRTPDLPTFDFEAGWGPEGASCVHHARIPENLQLAELAERCPRLADALGEVCTEDAADQAGALIMQRSIDRRGVVAGLSGPVR